MVTGFDLSDRLLRFHSYLYWSWVFEQYPEGTRAKLWLTRDPGPYFNIFPDCPFCNNMRIFAPYSGGQPVLVHDIEVTKVICICEVIRLVSDIRIGPWESIFNPSSMLNQIKQIDVPPGAAADTKKIVNVAYRWLNKPLRWLLLTGGTGTAKSHILFALRRAVGRFGCYITSTDFENKVIESISNNTTDEFLDYLIHAPFLFFDDFGMEHKSTGLYAINKLTHVIDQRYLLGVRAPLVMATNLTLEQLVNNPIANVQRIGSRMMDSDISEVLLFTQADYRLQTTKDASKAGQQ